MTAEEIPLTGGNVTAGVVRVGDTVRRRVGPWTPAVHALLEHLWSVGFRGAPRPLGIDEEGREVLTYAAGEVPWPFFFDLLEPQGQLARVGRLARDLHDALSTFTPPPDARWNVLIPADRDDLIVHHDLAPWNLVIGERWVFIDWDNAGPGSRLWDLAYAVHGFIPMSAHPDWQRADAGPRLRAFAEAYGLDEQQRRDLVPMLTVRTRAMHDFLRDQAALGLEPWATHWRTGHGDAWRSDAEYTERHTDRWVKALLD
ncbi:aminoglycoside phosphotransferase family protein [Micromonospora sp. KC207]|uniref:phosphotransferase n=1 Tax=Micromonospora sp. KC207 TaxID=2530377 RepID=UPI00104B0567|nr:phosphotransferase [Micromonospora sp. KC207]TDC66325.1 aminoglycoside phosphotransferase family protein [Micromonospora sp. KC207]